jgi:hypothetical protein
MIFLDKLLKRWHQGLQKEFSPDPANLIALGDQIVLGDRIIVALQRKAAIGEYMRWIPKKEKLPVRGQICDVFVRFSNGTFRICEMTYTSKSKGFDNGVAPLEIVTHWRPSNTDRPEGMEEIKND